MKNFNQTEVFRVNMERTKEVIAFGAKDAENLLIEMYADKNDNPVPPNLPVNNIVLQSCVNKALQNGNILPNEAESYIAGFESRFAQGYPNYKM